MLKNGACARLRQFPLFTTNRRFGVQKYITPERGLVVKTKLMLSCMQQRY